MLFLFAWKTLCIFVRYKKTKEEVKCGVVTETSWSHYPKLLVQVQSALYHINVFYKLYFLFYYCFCTT